MKKRFFRLLGISFIIVLLIAGTVIFIKVQGTNSPDESIKIARESLSEAKKVNADKFASGQVRTASELYESAMKKWKIENEKFFLYRNYDAIINLAKRSAEQSKDAKIKAEAKSGSLRSDLTVKIERLKKTVAHLQKNYTELPIAFKERERYQKGKILLSEASSFFKKNELLVAEQKYKQAEKLILEFNQKVEGILKNYFSHFNLWERWVQETIESSRLNNSYCVIVDKFAHECHLYFDGKLLNTFDAEFGKNWIGDKMYQGDQSTPEGKYMVAKKKENGSTRYHKALLINYPNDEDREQFRKNKQSGIIAAGKAIGGLVEIHGGGGKGANWTEGCVALSNRDMDRLFAKCSVGTKITIVGSLRNLDQIIN